MKRKLTILVSCLALISLGASMLPVERFARDVTVVRLAATPWVPINTGAVTVAGSDQTVLSTVDAGSATLLNLEIVNTGATLTDFKVQLLDAANGAYYTYLSGSDWTSTTNPNLRFASTDPSTMTTGTRAHVHVRINGADSVRILASCSTSTSLNIKGTLKTGG